MVREECMRIIKKSRFMRYDYGMSYFLALILFLFSTASSIAESEGGRQDSNFNISGISLKDNLIDFYNLEEIKDAKRNKVTYPKSKKYFDIILEDPEGEFDVINFGLKKGDDSYKIYFISGAIYCNSRNECKKEFSKYANMIRKMMPTAREDDYDYIYPKSADPTGKSIARIIDFNLASNDVVRIYHVDWSKYTERGQNFEDNLQISINSNEYMDFLNYEAY